MAVLQWVGISHTRTILLMSMFAILALTFSVITTPFVYADDTILGPLVKAKKYKLSPNYHVSQSKVCGISLCGHSNTPESVSVDIKPLAYNDPKKQASFDRAIEAPMVLSILRDYYAYKQTSYTVTPVQTVQPNAISSPLDNPFANPNYINAKTIIPEPIVEPDVIPYVVTLPPWIKSSYANPDFPMLPEEIPVPEPIVEEHLVNGTSVTPEINERIPEIPNERLNQEPMIVGTCGDGTELQDGVCVISITNSTG